MFLSFFYQMRTAGFKTSPTEWFMLLAGLQCGLHRSTLSGFYTLCRTVLLKSETEYDLFDCVFSDAFGKITSDGALSAELQNWLEHPQFTKSDFMLLAKDTDMTAGEVERLFRRRLREQTSEHNGGSRWIGTAGSTPFGNSGRKRGGIRVAGQSAYRSAYQVAGARQYRDWRKDNVLDARQFQMAFRALRTLSVRSDLSKTELDIQQTIHETCRRGGMLDVVYRRPRKNQLKLLILMDTGGSMDEYGQLCSLLFQSVHKASHFKDLKIYYFHNCIYSNLYTSPVMDYRHVVKTEAVIKQFSSDYRVMIVGDAEMDPEELCEKGISLHGEPPQSGYDRLMLLKEHFPYLVWLHPQPAPKERGYWTQTFDMLKKDFAMYRLSLEGLNQAIKKLNFPR